MKKVKNKNTSCTYQLNQDVLLYNQGDFVQLLDFNQGQFYALDRIATVMLSSVLNQGLEATITNLSQTYDTTEEEIRSNLTELLDNLIQKKLLIQNNIKLSNSQCILHFFNNLILKILHKIIALIRPLINPQSDPNFLTIHLLLILSWLSFRFWGWSKTIKLWRTWHQNNVKNTLDIEVIKTLDYKLQEASARNPVLSIMCKERALVGYHLLHTFYQLPATLIIGINNDPFEVHTWVECQGMILTDDPTHCQQFIPVTNYQ